MTLVAYIQTRLSLVPSLDVPMPRCGAAVNATSLSLPVRYADVNGPQPYGLAFLNPTTGDTSFVKRSSSVSPMKRHWIAHDRDKPRLSSLDSTPLDCQTSADSSVQEISAKLTTLDSIDKETKKKKEESQEDS